jgi:hypothetical protein
MLAQLDPAVRFENHVNGRRTAEVPDGPPAGTLLEMRGRSEFAFGPGGIVKIVDRS